MQIFYQVSILQLIIGAFAIWVAFKMFKGANVKVDESKQLPTAPMQMLAGGGIWSCIGNFWYWWRKSDRSLSQQKWCGDAKAVATSAACGLPIAMAGALNFIFFGAQEPTEIKIQLVMCISMPLLGSV